VLVEKLVPVPRGGARVAGWPLIAVGLVLGVASLAGSIGSSESRADMRSTISSPRTTRVKSLKEK